MPITFTKSVNLCWLLALQPKGKFIDLTFNKYRHGICNYSKSSWYKARIQDSGLGIIVCILETKFYIYVDGEKGETGSARRDGTWDPTYRPSSVNFYKYFYDYAYRFAGAACAEKPCSTVGTWVVWTVSIIAADSERMKYYDWPTRHWPTWRHAQKLGSCGWVCQQSAKIQSTADHILYCFQSSWLTNHIVMIALYYYLGKTGSYDYLCPVQTYLMQLVGACLLIPAIKNFLFTQADIVVHAPCEDKQIKMLILCISALGQQQVKLAR